MGSRRTPTLREGTGSFDDRAASRIYNLEQRLLSGSVSGAGAYSIRRVCLGRWMLGQAEDSGVPELFERTQRTFGRPSPGPRLFLDVSLARAVFIFVSDGRPERVYVGLGQAPNRGLGPVTDVKRRFLRNLARLSSSLDEPEASPT